MKKWEIWYVKQQYARQELTPPQPNDPDKFERMYLIITQQAGPDVLCCPVQNSSSKVGITEVELKRGSHRCITKDCKIVCHNIFTLPKKFFDNKVGYLKPKYHQDIQTAIIMALDLQ